MSESENKNVVLRFFENLSMGDIDAALALMDNDAVYWISGKPNQFRWRAAIPSSSSPRCSAHWAVPCSTV